MKLEVIRRHYTEKSTISDFYIDGYLYHQILEDVVRPSDAPKVYGQTAIPAGTYQVIIAHSPHFDRLLPRLLNMKGGSIRFGDKLIDDCGVLVHTGNKPEDTEGCLIMGVYDPAKKDWVSGSVATFDPFFKKLQYKLNMGEAVTLTITDTQASVVTAAPKAPAKAVTPAKKK